MYLTVTRQHRGCDLNSGSTALESSTLTTRLPIYVNVSGASLDSLKQSQSTV